MSVTVDDQKNQIPWSSRVCAVCGSKSIGINFGTLTCAPCKAFFRRNARRQEILNLPCEHRDKDLSTIKTVDDKSIRYLQIRRCSSCRLRRCFDVGMKADLVRTNEENRRHKELVDMNRLRRKLLRQKQEEKQLLIPQSVAHKKEFLRESDWRHLSNIVSAYDTYCLKSYIQQRSTNYADETTSSQREYMPMKHHTALPMSLTIALSSFIRSLPAFHCLSRTHQNIVCDRNLRPLLFLNMFELNQTCFSEPWQVSRDKSTWESICGPELFENFVRTENLAEKLLIADPIITRLSLVILFFSSSILCYDDSYTPVKIPKKKTHIMEIQNAYAALLWNYLSHRYGNLGAIQIYSDLIHVFLKMQRVGFGIGTRVRTKNELLITHKTISQFLTLDIRDS